MTRASWLPSVLGLLLLACSESAAGDELGDGEGESSAEGSTSESDTTDTTDDTSGEVETMASESSSETGDPDCTGPHATLPLPTQYEQPSQPTVPGSPWAYFELTDFQPQSCNFGQTYGLETFKGRVTLVSLMRSTCEICQGTIGYLEQMQIQLELEGHEVWFVVINQAGYATTQEEFVDRASFPLLQDTSEVLAWDLLNQWEPLQGTDDIYIYDAQGVLHSYFSYAADDPTIKLETQAGWDNVYNAILAAMQ
ncbi:TlpA family protein disulfide reductase [Nannocystaceae bacterium ST9]